MVRDISQKKNVAESSAGWPASTISNASRTRSAWKLASFVSEVQSLVGKPLKDVSWWGSSVFLEQFLVVAQIAIEPHNSQAWQSSTAPAVVTLAGRVVKISDSANAWSVLDFSALRASTRQYNIILDVKRKIKIKARGMGCGSWEENCEAARRVDFDEVLADIEDSF